MRNLENLKDKLKKYHGLSPYDDPSNIAYKDNYLLTCIEDQYTPEEIERAEKELGISSEKLQVSHHEKTEISLDHLTEKIKEWAKERRLDIADPNKQMLKLIEEVGELGSAMARSDEWKTADAIGDIYVVLTILSMQLNLCVLDCIEQAYEEIKDRKGKMVNGVFVKESDLRE